VCACVRAYVCMYVCVCMYVRTYVCMYVCVYVCMCVCMCMYVYMHPDFTILSHLKRVSCVSAAHSNHSTTLSREMYIVVLIRVAMLNVRYIIVVINTEFHELLNTDPKC